MNYGSQADCFWMYWTQMSHTIINKQDLLQLLMMEVAQLLMYPQVNWITPSNGEQGQTLSVSISGTNMNYGSPWSGTLV